MKKKYLLYTGFLVSGFIAGIITSKCLKENRDDVSNWDDEFDDYVEGDYLEDDYLNDHCSNDHCSNDDCDCCYGPDKRSCCIECTK